jgi:pre-mRNA cleavage complex 2 protein Pcf11
MSVYHQPPHHYYGHPPPAPVNYGYNSYQQHSPPPPVYHVDPSTFRRDYSNRLAELTVNSRPIIQSLSMLAQEQARFSVIVGQCLQAHIRRVPPWMKLPAFYLLDAISKNVHIPYAAEFAAFVIPLFLETYDLVDQNTKSKMEEMLLTWRTGSPAGKELFGINAQVAIERGIWGDGGNSYNANPIHPGPGHITKNQVISELEYAIGQKERFLQTRPYDTASKNQLTVLHQLHSLVEAGVSQEELKQILNQLRTLMRNSAPPPAPAPIHAPVSQPPPPPPVDASGGYWSQPYPLSEQSIPPSFHPEPMPNSFEQPHNPGNQIQPPPVAVTPDIVSMLTNLVKSGVVSSNGTPVGAGSSTREDIPAEAPGPDRSDNRSYRQAILGESLSLNSSDIMKPRSHLLLKNLYDSLPSQCKQCGARFSDSACGKKKMESHLDMHFRQNRQASQQSGRGHNRGWFISLEDWVSDAQDSKGKAPVAGSSAGRAAAAVERQRQDEELRSMFVVVPPGDEAKSISCPICKEILKSEFLEDDEEWVWKNAIMKDGKVYHATCHAEAAASTTTIVSRLRVEGLTSRSRSGTPDVHGRIISPRPSPTRPDFKVEFDATKTVSDGSQLAGLKRKAESDDEHSDHPPDTPPLKKVAI